MTPKSTTKHPATMRLMWNGKLRTFRRDSAGIYVWRGVELDFDNMDWIAMLSIDQLGELDTRCNSPQSALKKLAANLESALKRLGYEVCDG